MKIGRHICRDKTVDNHKNELNRNIYRLPPSVITGKVIFNAVAWQELCRVSFFSVTASYKKVLR